MSCSLFRVTAFCLRTQSRIVAIVFEGRSGEDSLQTLHVDALHTQYEKAVSHSGAADSRRRLILRGAVGFPPEPAIASSLLRSWSFGRFLSAAVRSSGVLRAPFGSNLSSLRFESRSARRRFGPLAEPAIAPTDPDKPWLLPTELATRSFAGSAH